MNTPKCPCGKEAITTIVQIPACGDCHAKYAEEGGKYLPLGERVFFFDFIEKARERGIPAATNYTFYGP